MLVVDGIGRPPQTAPKIFLRGPSVIGRSGRDVLSKPSSPYTVGALRSSCFPLWWAPEPGSARPLDVTNRKPNWTEEITRKMAGARDKVYLSKGKHGPAEHVE